MLGDRYAAASRQFGWEEGLAGTPTSLDDSLPSPLAALSPLRPRRVLFTAEDALAVGSTAAPRSHRRRVVLSDDEDEDEDDGVDVHVNSKGERENDENEPVTPRDRVGRRSGRARQDADDSYCNELSPIPCMLRREIGGDDADASGTADKDDNDSDGGDGGDGDDGVVVSLAATLYAADDSLSTLCDTDGDSNGEDDADVVPPLSSASRTPGMSGRGSGGGVKLRSASVTPIDGGEGDDDDASFVSCESPQPRADGGVGGGGAALWTPSAARVGSAVQSAACTPRDAHTHTEAGPFTPASGEWALSCSSPSATPPSPLSYGSVSTSPGVATPVQRSRPVRGDVLSTPRTTVTGRPARTPATQPPRPVAQGTPIAFRTPSRRAGAACTPGTAADAELFRGEKGVARRDAATRTAFAEFNAAVFAGALPSTLAVTWTAKLRTTAGVTKRRKATNDTRIELSSKVLDNVQRLRTTLLHEMCHAAVWLLDCEQGAAHGPEFWKWATIATRLYPQHAVTTCHNYDIRYKYTYQCTNMGCLATYGRHSKSIKVDQKVCGKCHGTLSLLSNLRKDGTPAKSRPATPYSLFVKDHFGSVRKRNPLSTHADVMKALSGLWREHKAAAGLPATPARTPSRHTDGGGAGDESADDPAAAVDDDGSSSSGGIGSSDAASDDDSNAGNSDDGCGDVAGRLTSLGLHDVL